MTAKRTQHSHRCPPVLTGDPHTDWVLWELSLTLSEIARNPTGEHWDGGVAHDVAPASDEGTVGVGGRP